MATSNNTNQNVSITSSANTTPATTSALLNSLASASNGSGSSKSQRKNSTSSLNNSTVGASPLLFNNFHFQSPNINMQTQSNVNNINNIGSNINQMQINSLFQHQMVMGSPHQQQQQYSSNTNVNMNGKFSKKIKPFHFSR
jgi:hypothetical protein